MSKSDILERLLDLAASHYGRPRAGLLPDADIFKSLGIDSFQALDLLSRLEEAFGCEIPDYELQGVTTFSGLADLIARRA
jgi:acyl carrier protein